MWQCHPRLRPPPQPHTAPSAANKAWRLQQLLPHGCFIGVEVGWGGRQWPPGYPPGQGEVGSPRPSPRDPPLSPKPGPGEGYRGGSHTLSPGWVTCVGRCAHVPHVHMHHTCMWARTCVTLHAHATTCVCMHRPPPPKETTWDTAVSKRTCVISRGPRAGPGATPYRGITKRQYK